MGVLNHLGMDDETVYIDDGWGITKANSEEEIRVAFSEGFAVTIGDTIGKESEAIEAFRKGCSL